METSLQCSEIHLRRNSILLMHTYYSLITYVLKSMCDFIRLQKCNKRALLLIETQNWFFSKMLLIHIEDFDVQFHFTILIHKKYMLMIMDTILEILGSSQEYKIVAKSLSCFRTENIVKVLNISFSIYFHTWNFLNVQYFYRIIFVSSCWRLYLSQYCLYYYPHRCQGNSWVTKEYQMEG